MEEPKKKKTGGGKGKNSPPRVWDWPLVEGLARIHCTRAEIESVLRIGVVQLDKAIAEKYGLSFQEWIAKFSSDGKISLRRKMFEQADRGNIVMLIWLSKQHLGMKEPAVELAQRKLEAEDISQLDDRSLEAVARRILQQDYEKQKKGGLKLA